jgi:hypothetical protein
MLEPGDAAAGSRARVMAAALDLGRSLDLWSLTLAALSLLSLLWMGLAPASTICLLLSLAAGAAQKLFALRTAFDAALFRQWAETAHGPVPTSLAADLAALDRTLAICGLRAQQGGALRDLDSRLGGAWKLLKTQALAFAIQFAAMIVAAAAARLLPAA